MKALTKREYLGMNIIIWALSRIAKYRSKKMNIEYKVKSVSFDYKSEEHSDDGVLEQLCLYELVMGHIMGIGMRISGKDRVHCSIEC